MRKFLLFMMVVACAITAQASYLMWQVTSADVGSFDANAVRIAYSTDGGATASGYLELQQVNDEGSGLESLGNIVKLGSDKGVPQLYADASNLTGASYSFFIELINYNSASSPVTIDAVAVSQAETYSNLTAKGFTGDTLMATIPTVVWHGGSFTAVPEPTSAMLVMVGLGLLALKRGKV